MGRVSCYTYMHACNVYTYCAYIEYLTRARVFCFAGQRFAVANMEVFHWALPTYLLTGYNNVVIAKSTTTTYKSRPHIQYGRVSTLLYSVGTPYMYIYVLLVSFPFLFFRFSAEELFRVTRYAKLQGKSDNEGVE